MPVHITGNITTSGPTQIGDWNTQTMGAVTINTIFNFSEQKDEIKSMLSDFIKDVQTNKEISFDNQVILNTAQKEILESIDTINPNQKDNAQNGSLPEKVNTFVSVYKKIIDGISNMEEPTKKLLVLAGKIGTFLAGVNLF